MYDVPRLSLLSGILSGPANDVDFYWNVHQLIITAFTIPISHLHTPLTPVKMTGPPQKRQKREDYKRYQESVKSGDGGKIQLPKKKFYRQRAHANPFSDHSLI
jgi:hypothetical protein